MLAAREVTMARLAGSWVAWMVCAAAFAEPAAYQPDWPAIAKHMVATSLELAPGERVLISYDAERDPALLAALRTEILRAGGIVSGEIPWPTAAEAKLLAACERLLRLRA